MKTDRNASTLTRAVKAVTCESFLTFLLAPKHWRAPDLWILNCLNLYTLRNEDHNAFRRSSA